MILDLTQYRFFKERPSEDALVRLAKLVPQSVSIMTGTEPIYDKWGRTPWRQSLLADDASAELFCHEIGHCMDLVNIGREDKLFIDNYGWARVDIEKWTLKSAINESRVFTYQWLLQEELGFSVMAGILYPEMTSLFLEGMVRKEVNRQYFLEKYIELKEELEPDWKDLLHKTFDCIVAAVDKERSKA